jgi:phosphopantothenate synthetase
MHSCQCMLTVCLVISGSLLLGVQADLPLHAVNNSAALQPSYLAGLAREVTTRLQINNRIRTESRDIMGASFLEEHAIRCMPDDNAPLEALCTIQHRRKTGKITQEASDIIDNLLANNTNALHH